MNKTIGHTIRDMRQARGWSKREFAKRTGLHESTIYRTEKAMRETQAKTLLAIFTAFGPEALVRWQETPEFYEQPARGLTWADPDEPLPSWILWVEGVGIPEDTCVFCDTKVTEQDPSWPFCPGCLEQAIEDYAKSTFDTQDNSVTELLKKIGA